MTEEPLIELARDGSITVVLVVVLWYIIRKVVHTLDRVVELLGQKS